MSLLINILILKFKYYTSDIIRLLLHRWQRRWKLSTVLLRWETSTVFLCLLVWKSCIVTTMNVLYRMRQRQTVCL